jgi:hypothetical protein
MNYRREFQKDDTVNVSIYSPRWPGETEARSDWKEVKVFNETAITDMTYQERVETIKLLLRSGFIVWIKTATRGGRMRIYIKKNDGTRYS